MSQEKFKALGQLYRQGYRFDQQSNGQVQASRIADGSVNNTEFQYLDGVTGAIQTQLDSKASASHTHALNDLSDCTIAMPAAGDALRYDGTNWVNGAVQASQIADGSVSNTEFQYLDGVTSAIQTQIDSKASASHTHTVNDLSDCTLTTPAAGDALRFDGTNWVNTDTNVTLGRSSSATGNYSVTMGHNASSTGDNAVTLGRNATNTAGELCIRVGNNPVTELKTGMGVFTYDSGAYNTTGKKWRVSIGGTVYDIALIPV